MDTISPPARDLHALARAREGAKDWIAAERHWLQAIQIDIHDRAAYAALAAVLRLQGRNEEARDLLSRAIERFGTIFELLCEQGRVAEAQKDWNAAGGYWRAAVAKNVAVWWAHLGLAVALREQNQIENVTAVLIAAAERFPLQSVFIEELARIAERSGDWLGAERHWRKAVAVNEDAWWTHTALGISLLHQGRLDEARTNLVMAEQRFGLPTGLLHAMARLCEAEGNWPEAERLWSIALDRDGETWWVYIALAQALKMQDRLAAAEKILLGALNHLPNQPELFAEYARCADARGDIEESSRRYGTLQNRFPDNWVGFGGMAAMLRSEGRFEHAQTLLSAAALRFAGHRGLLEEKAHLAVARNLWQEAAECWDKLRGEYPDYPTGYLHGAISAEVLGQPENAAFLLEEGEKRFPGNLPICLESARFALRSHKWAIGAEKFESVISKFPGEVGGYLGRAQVYYLQGRREEAEKILDFGKEHVNDARLLCLEYSRIPSIGLNQTRDWNACVVRSVRLCEQFPDWDIAHAFEIEALLNAGHPSEAEAKSLRYIDRFPTSPTVLLEAAKLAMARGNWATGAARYGQMVERFPRNPIGYAGLSEALTRLSRYQQSEDVILDAQMRFPHEPIVFDASAQNAQLRGDGEEALRRWEKARLLFPHLKHIAEREYRARLRITDESSFGGNGVTIKNGPHRKTIDAKRLVELAPKPMGEILGNFESLGGSWFGCEFGSFQRAHGQEPLGLLRWAEVPYESLLSAVEERFAGVGSDENTDLIIPEHDGRCEYDVKDRRFGFAMHTLVAKNDVAPELFRRQILRRLVFLREKLIKDLAESEKIFVYKLTTRNLSELELKKLYSALRNYGPNSLLYVQLDDSGKRDGQIELIAPGLMVGYIQRFAESPVDLGAGKGGPMLSWSKLCGRAFEIWRSNAGSQQFLLSGTASMSRGEQEPAVCETRKEEFVINAAHRKTTRAKRLVELAPKPMAEIVGSFESLGGSWFGCEFGSFQRVHGQEPLGLLRWADMSYEGLLSALAERFADVGSDENTDLIIPEHDGRHEYVVKDRRFGITMHTFVAKNDVEPEFFRRQILRRLVFLRKELIADLEDGNKIFVYKLTNRNLSDSEVNKLHSALRHYGPNSLLYVRLDESGKRDGEIELIAPGLMIGYIQRFAESPVDFGLGKGGPMLSWSKLCERAFEIWGSDTENQKFLLSGSASLSKGEQRPTVSETQKEAVISLANEASHKRNWTEAVSLWGDVRVMFPAELVGYVRGAEALAQLARFEDAERLIVDCISKFGELAWPLHCFAEISVIARNWHEAASRWKKVQTAFPEDVTGYLRRAQALRESGLRHDAERLLGDAKNRFPDNLAVAYALAENAMAATDWAVAAERWRDMREHFPDDVMSYIRGADAALHAGKSHEAATLIAEAKERIADDEDALAKYSFNILRCEAEICMSRHAWAEADQSWSNLRAQAPNEVSPYVRGALALRHLGQTGAALRLIGGAYALFPASLWVAHAFADAPEAAQDWKEAAERWASVRRVFPDDVTGFIRGHDALVRAGRLADAIALQQEASERFPHSNDILLMTIEREIGPHNWHLTKEQWSRIDISVTPKSDKYYKVAWRLLIEKPALVASEDLITALLAEPEVAVANWHPQIVANLAQIFFLNRDKFIDIRQEIFKFFEGRSYQDLPWLGRLVAFSMGVWKDEEKFFNLLNHYFVSCKRALIGFMLNNELARECHGSSDGIDHMFDVFIEKYFLTHCLSDIDFENSEVLFNILIFSYFMQSEMFPRAVGWLQRQLSGSEKSVLDKSMGRPREAIESICRSLAPAGRIRSDVAHGYRSSSDRSLRIALCVSGQLRGYKTAHRTWNRLRLDGHEVITFVHTWTNVGRKLPVGVHADRSFDGHFMSAYREVSASHDTPVMMARYPQLFEHFQSGAVAQKSDIMEFYDTEHVVVEDDSENPFTSYTNPMKMYYKIEKAYELAQCAGSFDLYIRIRPDKRIIESDPNLSWNDIFEESLRDHIVLSDTGPRIVPHGTFMIGDQFGVGAAPPIDVYSRTWSFCQTPTTADLYGFPPGFSGHTNLSHATLYQGVVVREMKGIRFDGPVDSDRVPIKTLRDLILADASTRKLDSSDRLLLDAAQRDIMMQSGVIESQA